MRTKKCETVANSAKEIAKSEPIVATESPTLVNETAPISVSIIEEATATAESFDVVFHFQKRENAESFIAKVKTLGYDNSELQEV